VADIRCSNCGQNTPDFLDTCQFCQTPLNSEHLVHTGEIPSEKDTGDLEPILPEWLQDARQQNRDSVDDNSVSPEAKPQVQKDEPLDLLAGLASQDDSDEDEVPDWLASINPVEDKKPLLPSTPDENDEGTSDFFAQFPQDESQPSAPIKEEEPAQNEVPSFLGSTEDQNSGQTDELADWLSQTNAESSEPVAEDNSWMDNLGSPEQSKPEPEAEKEPEDLSWLHNLETEAKETGDLSTADVSGNSDFDLPSSESSEEDLGWLNDLGGMPAPESNAETSPSVPASSQEDMSWMSNLGDAAAPAAEEPASAQSESTQDDLSWMSNLGDASAPTTEEPTPAQSESTQEDLSWMNDLGDAAATPAAEEPASAQPESTQDDLSWMSNLGDAAAAPATEEPASAQPKSSQDDLSWMSNLEGEQDNQAPEATSSQFTPPGTAPLEGNEGIDSTPEWLKSAMEEPAMPAPGDLSMDWFADHENSTESDAPAEMPEISGFQVDKSSASTQSEPDPASIGLDLPSNDSSDTSSQDVDAMFNIDMPDWTSQEPGEGMGQAESADLSEAGDDDLAPVDLPSWVQDMRPVESAIAETPAVDYSEQEAESEGPLAGFQGVIPSAPIGSSLRPKAFSLKLQVTDEQQAGASLIEQIIASETTVPSARSSTVVASQRMLRWILSALFLVVLSTVVGLGWQNFDIIAPGQVEVSQLSSLIGSVPDSSPVLLVMDYEPAVAGELAAGAGPILDQLALSRNSTFTFLSMSPNGSAMVEHLLMNTKISAPVSDDASDSGLGYQAGEQYFNAGFLPGGSAGVLGFIDDPVTMMPNISSIATVGSFSNFEAVILLTDSSESGRVWVEQLEISKQMHPELASKPLIIVSSAQAGPLLEPYASSGQVDVLINGLSDAAKYEYVNQSRPGIARAYWDSFGVGLMIAILSIVLGSIWNIFIGIRERRAEAELE